MTAFDDDGQAAGSFAHDLVLYLAVLLITLLTVLALVPFRGLKEWFSPEQAA